MRLLRDKLADGFINGNATGFGELLQLGKRVIPDKRLEILRPGRFGFLGGCGFAGCHGVRLPKSWKVSAFSGRSVWLRKCVEMSVTRRAARQGKICQKEQD
jgi:hypothetical protein